MRMPRLVVLVASLVLEGCVGQMGPGPVSPGRDGGAPEDGGGDEDGGPPTTLALALGDGGETGSLVGHLWTPGRDDAGIVNASSWRLLPIESWVEVQGTRLDGLDPVIKAAIPGWRDYGTEGWSGVANDWNGLTIDQRGNRVWLAGGGHAGSSNNGLYRFDFLLMKWSIEDLPSDPADWSTEYKTTGPRVSFTGFAPTFSLRMERKLVFMEGLKAILLVNHSDQNVYLYRLE